MTTTDLPDMYVLDSLASDLEGLDDILRILNSNTELGWRREWGRDFERADIIQALARLIRADSVRAYVPDAVTRGLFECPARSMPPGDFDLAWYGITERGRMIHANWEPPPDPPVS